MSRSMVDIQSAGLGAEIRQEKKKEEKNRTKI